MIINPKTKIWKFYLIKGKEYIKKGKFRNAYDELSKSIHFYEIYYRRKNHEAHFLRGMISNKWGLHRVALRDLELAIKYNPKPGYFEFYELAEILLNLKEYKKAKPIFSKALLFKNEDYNSLFNRGACSYENGAYKAAIRDFNRANKIKIDYDLFFNRALCYLELRDYKMAISNFNLAINCGYKKKDIFLFRGICKSRKMDYKNAIGDFKKAINSKELVNKELGYAYLEKGWAHIRIGEYKKGLEESDKGEIIFKAKGNDYFLHLINKAYSYIKLNKTNAAISVLDNTSKNDLKLEKHQLAFLLMLKGLSFTLQGDHNEALKDFEKMFLKDPDILEKDEESIFDEVPEYMKNLIRISLCINLN